MNTAEIIVREVQSDSGLQVRQLLAERIGQPRQAAKLHSHSEVLPFNVAGRDMGGVRVALSNFGYNQSVIGLGEYRSSPCWPFPVEGPLRF